MFHLSSERDLVLRYPEGTKWNERVKNIVRKTNMMSGRSEPMFFRLRSKCLETGGFETLQTKINVLEALFSLCLPCLIFLIQEQPSPFARPFVGKHEIKFSPCLLSFSLKGVLLLYALPQHLARGLERWAFSCSMKALIPKSQASFPLPCTRK